MNFDKFLKNVEVNHDEVSGNTKLKFLIFKPVLPHFYGFQIAIHHRDFLPEWLDDYDAIMYIFDHQIPILETKIKVNSPDISITDFIGSEFTVCYEFIREVTIEVGFDNRFQQAFYNFLHTSIFTLKLKKEGVLSYGDRGNHAKALRGIKNAAETMSKLQAL